VDLVLGAPWFRDLVRLDPVAGVAVFRMRVVDSGTDGERKGGVRKKTRRHVTMTFGCRVLPTNKPSMLMGRLLPHAGGEVAGDGSRVACDSSATQEAALEEGELPADGEPRPLPAAAQEAALEDGELLAGAEQEVGGQAAAMEEGELPAEQPADVASPLPPEGNRDLVAPCVRRLPLPIQLGWLRYRQRLGRGRSLGAAMEQAAGEGSGGSDTESSVSTAGSMPGLVPVSPPVTPRPGPAPDPGELALQQADGEGAAHATPNAHAPARPGAPLPTPCFALPTPPRAGPEQGG
jgi:hypothetical protein